MLEQPLLEFLFIFTPLNFIVSIHTLYPQLLIISSENKTFHKQAKVFTCTKFGGCSDTVGFPSDASGHGCRIRFQSINQRFFVQTSLQKGYN